MELKELEGEKKEKKKSCSRCFKKICIFLMSDFDSLLSSITAATGGAPPRKKKRKKTQTPQNASICEKGGASDDEKDEVADSALHSRRPLVPRSEADLYPSQRE